MQTPAFTHPVRIYWEDTDSGGVVYHARYVAFLERARSEWMRAMGYDQTPLRDKHDLVFVVHAMQLNFHKPARLDDVLQVSVVLCQCRRASFIVKQPIARDGERLFDAEVKLAAVRASTLKPRAMPDWLQQQLSPLISESTSP